MLTFRELKYLIHDVLFEGVEQDRQSLIELYPAHKNELMHLGHKWIMWLMMRFGVSKSVSEVHPFEDTLATVKSYSQRDAAAQTLSIVLGENKVYERVLRKLKTFA